MPLFGDSHSNSGVEKHMKKLHTTALSPSQNSLAQPRTTPNKSFQLIGKNDTPADKIRQSFFKKLTLKCHFPPRHSCLPLKRFRPVFALIETMATSSVSES